MGSVHDPASLCAVCDRRVARRDGPECRTCYKTNRMRAYRHDGVVGGEGDRVRLVSLDVVMGEVDKLAYREWLNEQ